jgi:hypothetical protein
MKKSIRRKEINKLVKRVEDFDVYIEIPFPLTWKEPDGYDISTRWKTRAVIILEILKGMDGFYEKDNASECFNKLLEVGCLSIERAESLLNKAIANL